MEKNNKSDPKVQFPDMLKKLMKKNKMSGKQLSLLVATSESNVSAWIQGKSFPADPVTILRYSRVFNVSMCQLIFGEEEFIDEDTMKIKKSLQEITAGKFELILRPIRD